MTDVIFSGSKSRNPLNVASVTLVFDNSDHYLPIDFNEVAIKRRVYKDGTNEYYLNGEKCRLKDIIDILLDSGIAKESLILYLKGKLKKFYLISQQIDVLFRRSSRCFKIQRKEEAYEIRRNHDNMNRVNDIISERSSS